MAKNMKMAEISAPVVTPYHDDGSVNYDEYKKLVKYISSNGCKGIFVCGTTGEFINLTLEEREELLLAAIEGAVDGTSIMFNITAMNLRDMDRLTEFARSRGIDRVSVTAPYYHKYDDDALVAYFKTISQHTQDMSLYLYNMSAMTQNPITASVLKKVLEQCDNICGIKDSSMDFATIQQYQCVVNQPDFEIITGNDSQVLAVLQAGAYGGIIATAGVYPRLASSIFEKFQSGDLEGARNAQKKILLLRDLFRSVMPVMAHKKALELQGFHTGPARFPFRDLTAAESRKVEDGIKNIMLE